MAGSADYKGRLNAVASQLLDDLKGTDRYSKDRRIDEVFPERVTLDNADETLLALAPRTPVSIRGNQVTGGEAILDPKGRVNMDQIPSNPAELYHTAPDAVNGDLPAMNSLLNPESYARQDGDNPELARAQGIGRAMRDNDTAAYKKAGMPIEVDEEAAAYIAGQLVRGRGNTPLRSNGFVKSGGIGTESREQILIPGTDTRFVDADKATQGAYLDARRNSLVGQWLRQGGASIANPSTTIVPPGSLSHMDHVQALSSSRDTIGEKGWGYSDADENYSYLDAEANVHSKLNYDIQSQHQLMRLADFMRRNNMPAPARLSQSQLGDKDRKRLSGEEALVRQATDKATDIRSGGEALLKAIQLFNGL
jgi:hypothetical protein